jgi:aldehyde dehydrogenase (NAD+)
MFPVARPRTIIGWFLPVGAVDVSAARDVDPQAPWGGFKYSGVGREYGRYGIEAFLETRAVLERLGCCFQPGD